MAIRKEEESSIMSVANIIKSFRYWPRIMRLLWATNAKGLVAIMVLNLFHGVSPIIVLILTKNLINAITYSWNTGFNVVLWAFGGLVGFTLLSQLLSLAQSYLESLFKVLLMNRINRLIMEKSISLSLKDFENAGVQDALKLAQNEAGHRPYQIMQQMLALISGVVTLFSAAGILIVFRWWMAFILLIIPFTSFYSFLRIGQQEFLLQFKRIPKMRKAWYYSFLMTNDKNFKEVKLYQLGKYLLGCYNKLFRGFYCEDKHIAKKRLNVGILFQFINLMVNGLMMFVVLRAAFFQEIEIGTVVALTQTITMTQSNSQSLISGILSLCQHNLYLKQLFVFLDLKVKKVVKEKCVDVPAIETIEFKNVSFQYPDNPNYALRHVSFKIKPGETIAIVGRNGSGKTTLIKLLTQLYDEFEGDILINGMSIRSFDQDALRQRMTVVFQDFVQYELNMRHNIGFGHVNRLDSDDVIMEAAKRAGIDSLVEDLPQELDTQIGRLFEQGSQLSGGQWQRVAIARAFMRQADVYILDEPSSMLDPESERDVFEKFRELIHQHIGIFISHRYTSIKYADHIVMMDQGKVIELGSHQELIAKDGVYAYLYNMQLAAYSEGEKEEVQYDVG
ncbi:ABC transporter ATP-binding protein [Vallitalea pronyensis]|uniref:ABC transporter ATP-binding protein n=1 Tax=Vallitalea pronyensis TaxID=1348613 RepID=A0A8J8MHS1_9FIRM|nr:ABC transporter ATP-binding protein [Vallitalea pronyensis]QUI21682.1 ABC transporter ATP-binding protein [Vallitalea pronyensis]